MEVEEQEDDFLGEEVEDDGGVCVVVADFVNGSLESKVVYDC